MKHLSLLLTLALATCSTQGMVAESETETGTETKTINVVFLAADPITIEVPKGPIQVEELCKQIAPLVGCKFFQLVAGTEILENETDTTSFNSLTVIKLELPLTYEITRVPDEDDDMIIRLEVSNVIFHFNETKFSDPGYEVMVEQMYRSKPDPWKGDFDCLDMKNIYFRFDDKEIKINPLTEFGFSIDLLLYLIEGRGYIIKHHADFLDNDSPKSGQLIHHLLFNSLFSSIPIRKTEIIVDISKSASKYGYAVDLGKIK